MTVLPTTNPEWSKVYKDIEKEDKVFLNKNARLAVRDRIEMNEIPKRGDMPAEEYIQKLLDILKKVQIKVKTQEKKIKTLLTFV